MDQFEAARLKHEKLQEQKKRYAANAVKAQEPAEEVPVVEAPKEKAGHAAFIHVKVVLPDRELMVCFKKSHIYQNITPNRLTKGEIRKCVEDGFRSLLGGLDEVR